MIEPKELTYEDTDLYQRLEFERPLSGILTKGRLLRGMFHDTTGDSSHAHNYRKVLRDYDPETQSILLSKIGSRKRPHLLKEPEKEFSLDELFRDAESEHWRIEEAGEELF